MSAPDMAGNLRPSLAAAALLLFLAACGQHPIANNETAPAPAKTLSNLARPSPPVAARPGPPLVGRCWMGGCTWFRILSRQLVRDVNGERLIRAALLLGVSDAPNGNPETPRDARILWDETPAEVWLLCSANRPTVIYRGDTGGWEASTLDFVGGPYGVNEQISSQYVAACHPGDHFYSPNFAARHHYRAMTPEVDTHAVASPEAEFDHQN